ncbi:ATP-binding cassette domain-containing protein [Terrabacter sp. NPDC080008]|uniref:ABC transporter ATP-binding protein n=1 Tax=Terrabacter sp. NPDC080008 TaxID=3155176 RepID=UPI00344DACF5
MVDAKEAVVAAPVVGLHGVTVRYGRATALEEVSVSFGPGVTGLLGHNGAGKSTLMGVLTGMVRPTLGDVRLSGAPVTTRSSRMQLRQALGVLPQRFEAFPAFRVRDFIGYAAWLRRLPAAETSAAIDRALFLVGLTALADRRIKDLSGGMLQRVGIACAVVHQPRVLVLDEPSNGLDIEQRAAFRDIVRSLDPTTTTIISSHLAEDVAAVCQRVVVLQQGRVVAEDTLAGLIAGTRPPEGPGEHSDGVGPPTVDGPSLEQAYLRVLAANGR